jgi:hypothetical protein
MRVVCGEVTNANLEECLAVEPRHIGHELVGKPAAMRAWRDIVKLPFTIAVAIVRPGPGGQIVGFGLGCFVSKQFIDAELANPRPGTNARFMERFVANPSVVLNRAEIARANAGAGVDFLQLYGTLSDTLSPEEQLEAVALLFSKCSEHLNGYRVRTFLSEIISTSERQFTNGSGTRLIEFRDVNRFLACATRESVAQVPSSVGLGIFVYKEPELRLRVTDQELLLAALTGATDQEIGCVLGLTQDAVKARWRSALARIAEARPDLIDRDDRLEGRGPQKRHRVLAYIRDHFEELRPFEWRARKLPRKLTRDPPIGRRPFQ